MIYRTQTAYERRYQFIKVLRSRGLSVRLVAATLMYSIVAALIVSAIQIFFAYHEGVKRAEESLSQLESSHVLNLASSLWEVNPVSIETLMDGIYRMPDVGLVRLTDETGQSTVRVKHERQAILTRDIPLIYREGEENFPLGVLHIELANVHIMEQLKRRAFDILMATLLTLLLGSVFVLILFQRLVTRHLKQMAKFATELDLDNLHSKLQLHRKDNVIPDELDLVVVAINKMQITLQADLERRQGIEAELRMHKEQLESVVALRTESLETKSALLQQQTGELEAQNIELNAFAHSVAHDLKNPLTTVLGMARLMESRVMSDSPEKMHQSVGVIHRTALKMGAIIDALLLLASVRRADDVRRELFDVQATAHEACARLSELATRHHATINFTPDWHVALGYPQWIEEVWMNYISNAIKYGGDAPIIEIGCAAENKMIRYWVRDHGDGIPILRQPELFIQFSRLAPQISEGHGLGLSIVKRIIERLDGRVGYQDADGGGGCFWFTLPSTANCTHGL